MVLIDPISYKNNIALRKQLSGPSSARTQLSSSTFITVDPFFIFKLVLLSYHLHKLYKGRNFSGGGGDLKDGWGCAVETPQFWPYLRQNALKLQPR